MTSFEKLKELDLSHDEIIRIGEALKQEEFRKLLIDYVEEVQNPENKKIFQQEIVQLEKERGIDATFINPNPCYVIKTILNGDKKCFINICTNDNVPKPTPTPETKSGNKGINWAVPHTLSPPRDDIDNKKIRCRVFDVVFHPLTLDLAHKNKEFYKMVNNTALDAIETHFNVTLDKINLKYPKIKYKGVSHATIVRKPSKNKDDVVEREGAEKEFFDKIYAEADSKSCYSPSSKHINVQKKKKKSSNDENLNYTTPKYVIKHRSHINLEEFTNDRNAKINSTIPKELIIEINLPLIKSSSDITLDVTEKTIQLTSEKSSKYKLHLTLPYKVCQDDGNAKFDKELKKLLITLPVKRPNITTEVLELDSGVESDHGIISLESDDSISDEIVESSKLKTNFLDDSLHYSLPEFTCHIYNYVIAFTLNVKNVDATSVMKKSDDTSTIHLKFTSISSSFYTTHFSFFVKFINHTFNIDEVTIETWDNNVVLQIPLNEHETVLEYYLYGLNANNLYNKYLEEPYTLNILNPLASEKTENIGFNENITNNNDDNISRNQNTSAINICNNYESSGDEFSYSFSPSKGKGILKRLSNNRSISESSLDDIQPSSSIEFDLQPPNEGDLSTSLKKTVRFNDVIKKQLYRSNSSILGQKKKNQRKSRNKKRAQERRHSESEASEFEDKIEEENQKNTSENIEEINNDIFQLDMNC